MLYGEIIWGGEKLTLEDQDMGFVQAEGIGGGAPVGGGTPGVGSIVFPGPIYPGTVEISDGTNTYTETSPGSGILDGAPAGEGTIDYAAGVAKIVSDQMDGPAMVATFTYNTRRNNLPSPVAPMIASLWSETAGEFLILVRDAPGPWRTLATLNQAAQEVVDLGFLPRSYICVFATGKGRLNGRAANPV